MARQVLHAGVGGQLGQLVGLGLRPRRRSRRRARSPSTPRPSTLVLNFSRSCASPATAASSKCSGRMPAITSRAVAVALQLGRICSGIGAVAERQLDRVALEPARQEVHRRRADEARDEQVHRVLVEDLRRVDLLDDAGAHDRDAVAERHGLGLVVRHVDRRRAELAAGSARPRCASARAAWRRGSTAARPSGTPSGRARSRGPSPRAGAGRRTGSPACGPGAAGGRGSAPPPRPSC